MRKKILLQIAVIIAVFMTAMLVIIEAAFSYSATRLFIEAKKDFLDRDLKGISGELFPLGYVPELRMLTVQFPWMIRSLKRNIFVLSPGCWKGSEQLN